MSLTVSNLSANGINLFSGNSSNYGMESLLGEYHTIKSGNYGKLLKTYIAENGSEAIKESFSMPTDYLLPDDGSDSVFDAKV